VAPGMTSVLVVAVVQRQREIGILRTIGATRGALQRISLLQVAIVGGANSTLISARMFCHPATPFFAQIV
jgi:ABC-type lipoprotein release transport system permease subunit